MSADNWEECPKCKKKKEALERKLEVEYGIIPKKEYEDLQAEVISLKSEPKFSLREDWEIGIYDGEFEVDYGASCDKCGFKFRFKHNETIVLT